MADSEHNQEGTMTIVGIGASAGGLNALKSLFAAMPADTGAAFVVVVHLSPEHKSHLAELIQPHSAMPVQQVTETVKLEPNRVYIIPPAANLNTIDTHLRLSDLEPQPHKRATVDHDFRTLADTHDGHSIGVVLTGTGSDGTLGLRYIKEAGGVTIAQDPSEAEYDGMPRSAVVAGVVDFVLPIERIAEEVARLTRVEPQLRVPPDGEELNEDHSRLLHKIFAQIRSRTGHDFSQYKRSTVMRRIQRRMQLQHVESLERYLEFLRDNRDEVRDLFDDLLITVTEFFRDQHVFECLEDKVIPALFEGKTSNDRIRVWSVGCSTGEEAYSIAILLLEELSKHEERPRLQVFASDLHERSLTRAREGIYPLEISTNVPAEWLQRYFIKENDNYRVRREVREMVVFAPHNLLGDPPFSHLDLIVCRNVMIYLQRDVQRDVIRLFHYALEPDGRLVLGTSETVDRSELFTVEDKQSCVYRRRNVPTREVDLPILSVPPRTRHGEGNRDEDAPRRGATESYGVLHERVVERYAPPSVLINADHEIVHSSTRAGRYMEIPGGEPTRKVFKLLREPLGVEVRAALAAARRSGESTRSQPVRVKFNGESRRVVVHIHPARDAELEGFTLVVFDELPEPISGADDSNAEQPSQSADATTRREMDPEVELYRQRLQATIEEYESSREEMQASNEELQSANEELRSTMEELETSKEEL
ncbi:MAG: PAS domain-containing protein, partial [Planctomycetales bacterium]|nr:PAS domain-containing protein [Planctomycetales bacterium]